MFKKRGPTKRPIVQVGHRALRTPAKPVDEAWIGTPEFMVLRDDMIETMRQAPGVGLAAPQIGLSMQLVVLEDREEVVESLADGVAEASKRTTVPLTTLVNPTLELMGEERVQLFEGCLSLSGFAAITERSLRARVHALDEHGKPLVLEWEGWPARILQHEVDHLNATLYIDHMDTTTFASVANLEASDDV